MHSYIVGIKRRKCSFYIAVNTERESDSVTNSLCWELLRETDNDKPFISKYTVYEIQFK